MSIASIFSINHLRTGAFWLLLLIGVACYYFGYFQIEQTSIWKEVVIKIGDVFVIGVILGFLTNAAQFLGIFKKDLQDIIYGKEFLKQRKDITPLWETVSIQMFKEKFPTIHKDFLRVIRSYFPNNEVSFYNDYEDYKCIEWIDKEHGLIKVTDNISFELIAESTNEFIYPLKTWTRVIGDTVCETKIKDFTINGVQQQLKPSKSEKDGDDICYEQKIPMKGCTKYQIKYTQEKTYNINEDYYIGFRAKYIVNGLRVGLEYPDDIDAIFTCRGTQQDFEDVKRSKHGIEKRYKGIILPRQGFIFVVRTIK